MVQIQAQMPAGVGVGLPFSSSGRSSHGNPFSFNEMPRLPGAPSDDSDFVGSSMYFGGSFSG
jgi:hypothetical protein